MLLRPRTHRVAGLAFLLSLLLVSLPLLMLWRLMQ
jgi:hypothetical protein